MLSLKPIAALLVIICLLAGLDTHAQQVTLSYKNSSLKTVFEDIEKQTGYVFFYDRALLRLAGKVTVQVKDMPLHEALDQMLKGHPIEWVTAGKTITLRQTRAVAHEPSDVGPPPMLVKGIISNEMGEAVPGATIFIKGTGAQVAAGDDGSFSLTADSNSTLLITSVTYETQEVALAGRTQVSIRLKKSVAELSQAVISTGYQRANGGNLTGSFVKINNELLNRRVSPNILDHIDGITSGLLFDKNISPGLNQSTISIRGRSTIYANAEPLIVLDNFPYTGDINNINPADIESITVLKDAAAAAIWGALSGNGVIVITTKKGKYNQSARVSFTSSVMVGGKPAQFYKPVLSSADYISVEDTLFRRNYYNDWETDITHRMISPAVEIMIKRRDGKISATEAGAALDALGRVDVRNDLTKYFYRNSVNQQYALNLSGGCSNCQYYFSAGYDRNLSNAVGNAYNRITLNANNTYALVKQKLELNTGIIFSAAKTTVNNARSLLSNYPYSQLAGPGGTPLTVFAGYRQPYKDTAGGGNLLNWNYKPIDELRMSDDVIRLTDYRINLSLKYSFIKGLDASVYYQYNKGSANEQNYRSASTYFTRDLINQYTQPGFVRAIPMGGIYDKTVNDYEANNIRAQVNFNHTWKDEHDLTAIAGAELRSVDAGYNITRRYGYDKGRQTSIKVDYLSSFSLYQSPSLMLKIPLVDIDRSTTDHYISYYSNAVYAWKHRYILSASARRDESNLFGVKTNQKGVPLWSAGLGWIVSKEDFYRCSWLPYLKLRVTNGYNGNVDRTVSAYTTILVSGVNTYGAPSAIFNNPANSALRWEKTNMTNAGVDFAFRHDRVSGSLDYYIKRGRDLMGYSPIDPTTGFSIYKGNTADMSGKGLDLVLNIKSNDKVFRWYGTVLLSYATDKVTSYKGKQSNISYYYNTGVFNPLQGNPVYSVYALKWMGLDPQTGDPLGFLKGHTSNDYVSINTSTDFSDLIYKGPANPTMFGSMRNTLSWKQLELSFTITWKAGYYFRRTSITYDDLFRGSSPGPGHPDFDKRWQKTGDERNTNVPSMNYPGDPQRDAFYKYSEILVDKADHIRLQDIRLGYELNKEQVKKLHVRGAQLYVYANNIGLLWKANNKGIDPDYVTGIPNPRSVAIGVKIDF